MKHLISVICPVSNEPEHVFKKCVDSILNQTYRDIQLIIIDDGSTSESVKKVCKEAQKDPRTVYKRREKTNKVRTVSEAFNMGESLANGNWLAHNASDNYFEPDWAEKLLQFIKGREDEINGVCTNWVKHNYDGTQEIVDLTSRWDFNKPTLENYIRTESVGGWIYKTDWCKKIGWDVRFPRKQTREWHIRLFKTGDIIHCPRFLWHFIQWEPDQQKNYASIHWRILADLKNGMHDAGNLMFGLQLSQKAGDMYLYYAAISAYNEFMNDPKWKNDFEKSPFKKEMERVKEKFWEEATED